jgi:hypothetical protein
MRRLQFLAAITIAFMMAASGAKASLVFVTYKGVITNGSDETGLYGKAGSLTGESYSLTYILDTADPSVSSFNPPYSSSYSYNHFFSNGNPQFDLKIGGNGPGIEFVSFLNQCQNGLDICSVGTNRYAGLNGKWGVDSSWTGGDFGKNIFTGDNVTYLIRNSSSITSTTDKFVTNYDYRVPMFHVFQAGDIASGNIDMREIDVDTLSDVFYVKADLSPTSVTVRFGGIPEPSAWVMMILGFFALGGAARVRRRMRPASPAV